MGPSTRLKRSSNKVPVVKSGPLLIFPPRFLLFSSPCCGCRRVTIPASISILLLLSIVQEVVPTSCSLVLLAVSYFPSPCARGHPMDNAHYDALKRAIEQLSFLERTSRLEQLVLAIALLVAIVFATAVYWRRGYPKLPPLRPLPPLPPLASLPEPTDYTHAAAEIIERFGDWSVVGLKIRREPVTKILSGIIDAASGGAWAKALQRMSYSNIFHLGVVVELESPSITGANTLESEILIEKNEVVCVKWPGAAGELMEYKRVRFVKDAPRRDLTLRRFLSQAQAAVHSTGRNWFVYDAFRGQNCQDFVLALLTPLGEEASSPMVANLDEVKEFVKQDVDTLVRELPPRVALMARAVTDAGAAITGAVDEAAHRIKERVRKLRKRA